MSLIKRLQEAKSLNDVAPILNGRYPATFKKVVETAMILKNHADPAQQQIGEGFLRTAIQEADKMPADEQPTNMHHDDGVKPKKNHFVKEEELDNHNPESGNKGSDQSSENEEPFTAPGETEGHDQIEGMESADGIERGGEGTLETSPLSIAGVEPHVAQEIANQMGKLPTLNTSQALRQINYSVQEAVKPLRKTINQQAKYIKYQHEAIKALSNQVREISAQRGGMSLDLNSMKEKSLAKQWNPIHETVNTTPIGPQVSVHSKEFETQNARTEISNLDKMYREQSPGVQ